VSPARLPFMARTRVLSTGPGFYENVELRVWRGRSFGSSRERYVATYRGTVPAYCGNGWEHRVAVRGRVDEFEPVEDGGGFFDFLEPFRLLRAAYRGDLDAAWYLLELEIQRDLEDWDDPCETGH
jgi:hypothetical protein